MFRHVVLLLLLSLSFGKIFGQKVDSTSLDSTKRYIQIIYAKKAKYGKGKDSAAQKLIGEVKLKHNEVILTCDSAYFYQRTNSIKAFSNVRLNQADTLFLTGNRINYSGETKIAEVIGNVKLEDPTTYLECKHLYFYREQNKGSYYTGGRLFSKGSPDTLSSTQATYYSEDKIAIFRKNVVLKNPEYVMETDTMKYSTEIKQSYFYGPTTITSDSNTIYCNAGWYNTETNKSSFYNRAIISSPEQKLEGDSLYYDRNTGLGKAFGNIVITDTINNFMVTGERAFSYNEGDSSIIPSRPLLYHFMGKDTLLVSSDTVYTKQVNDSNKQVFAFHNVLFHKSDVQGKCDTIIFDERFQRLDMIDSPILWSDKNQITGDKISLFVKEEVIDRLFIPKNAFIGEQVDGEIFNQIKGKNLTAFFKDGDIYKVEIRGNGESIYHALEEGVDSLGKAINILAGVNQAICSDMDIRMQDSEITEINFITSPKSTLHPPTKILDEKLVLKNFTWHGEVRPESKKVVKARGNRVIKFNDPIVSPQIPLIIPQEKAQEETEENKKGEQ
ncbi:OstA-like protein [Luteibaculum oceani]|uniref:Organic solvent tolerance-like N-terminal domain-containing protein n=1 Tax=Luteibaculum oceani TaxID=1294296 RepID=A0A5C6V810_9FLAO|nr:OstA-like protein [Luteibaculum oceani]TXC81442.1 hypothetical protein FRX97_05400 [Luteibaculum oceani]